MTGNQAYWSWKVLEIHVTQGKTMKCMADSKKKKKRRDLGSKRVIHEF